MRKIIFILILIIIPIVLFADNITWKLVNSNTINNLTQIHFLNENTGIAIGFSGTLLKTIDAGETWNQVSLNSYTALSTIFFIDSLRGWIGGTKSNTHSQSEVLYYTDDGGSTWIAKPISSLKNIIGIYFFDNENGLVADNNGNVYSTNDNGANWDNVYQGGFITKGVKYFNNLVWLYGYFGNILTSSDKGLSWNKLTNFPPNVNIYNMASSDSSVIWVCGNGGAVYSTSDNGKSWQKSNSNTTDYIWTIDFFDENNGLYGGGWTSSVIGYTSDGGVSWDLQELPTNNYITGIKTINQNRFVAVGKSGTILIGEKQKTDINEKLSLTNYNMMIFPNPILNSQINLNITVKKYSNIKLDLINSLGISVGNSYSNFFDAGTYCLQYTISTNLPSGTYWLRITINNKKTLSKPVVILR